MPYYQTLIDAVKDGDLSNVRDLILSKRVTQLDQSDELGATALMWAAARKDVDKVRLLIEAGASVNHATKTGNPALMQAANVGGIEVVKYLIEVGANVNHVSKSGDTALMFAADNNHIEVVKHLIEVGANVDYVNPKGETALMWAASARRTEVVKYLIEVGASVHHVYPAGDTVLTAAAERGNDAMIKAILGEALIDVNASEADFNAALERLNVVTEKLKKDNLKKDRKIVRSYLVKFLNEDYQAELSHPSLDRLNVCLLRLNAIKDNLQVIQPNEEEQKKGKQKSAMQAIDSLISVFSEKIAAIQPPAENSISAKLLALFQAPDSFKITSGLMFELVSPSPDQVGEIRRIVAGLPVEQRKQLRSTLSRTLSETAAKNELADPDQWIKVLHYKYKDEGKSIPLIAILRVSESGEKIDYNTSSWREFMRIMKNGQFTKGAVKSHVEKMGTFKNKNKEDETGQKPHPKLAKHQIGNKDL